MKLGDILSGVFILIVVYLLVVYYKGAAQVGDTLFKGFNATITSLQGRSGLTGSPSPYPAEG